jgi:hypothetical protein
MDYYLEVVERLVCLSDPESYAGKATKARQVKG